MPLTIDKASDDVAFMFIDLVTDNLKTPEDKHANETAAKAKFDKMIVKITKRDFTILNLKKLCKAIETKIVGYAEMTRDIPGAYNRTSAKPLIPKTELDAIRKKLARDACDYFDDFAQDTLLNFGRSSSSSSSREKKSRKVKRVGGNKSKKQRK